jgi:C_GCAxxG_C_C family probable redox protein
VSEHLLDGFPELCRRMGTGFAGGLGGTHQELCGALSGGVIAIGALLGRSTQTEDDRPAMDLSSRYRAQFLAEFGETQCAKLGDWVHAPGGLGSCSVLVERSTAILLRLLQE